MTLKRQSLARLFILFTFFALEPSIAHAKRIALLIANQDYSSTVGVLHNPTNDAALVARSLEDAGFKVLPILRNASRGAMLSAVRHFNDVLNAEGPDAIGFFYYSGHGAAEPRFGVNYLIPVDAGSPSSVSFWDESLKLDDLLAVLERSSAAKVVVFDACRNELNLGTRASGTTEKGLVPVNDQAGMLIAFATSPRRTASDVGEGSGPYAAALAREIRNANTSLDHLNLFQNVKEAVVAATNGVQRPWVSDGLTRRLYLSSRPAHPAAAAPPAPTSVDARPNPVLAAASEPARVRQIPPEVIELVPQVGHSGNVDSLAVTPNGQLAVSAAGDGSLKLWSLETRTLLRNFAPGFGVSALAFSKDGTRLAAGGAGGKLMVWTIPNWDILLDAKAAATISALTFAEDGQTLLAGTTDGTVETWSIAARRAIDTRSPHRAGFMGSGGVSRIIARNRAFISGGRNGTIHIAGAQTKSIQAHASGVFYSGLHDLALSADGSRIVSVGSEGDITLWNAATGSKMRSWETGSSSLFGKTGGAHTVAFLGNDEILAVLPWRIVVFSATSGDRLSEYRLEQDSTSAAVLADRGLILLSSRSGALQQFRLKEAELVSIAQGIPAQFEPILMASLPLFVTASGRDVNLWELPTGKLAAQLEHEDEIKHLAVAQHGRIIATASKGAIEIWDAQSRERRHRIRQDAGVLAITRDGSRTAAGLLGGDIAIYNSSNGRIALRWNAYVDGYISLLAFSRDGLYLISFGIDKDKGDRNLVRSWDVATGNLQLEFEVDRMATAIAVADGGASALAVANDKVSIQQRRGVLPRSYPLVTEARVLNIEVEPSGHFSTLLENGRVSTWRVDGARLVQAGAARATLTVGTSRGIPTLFGSQGQKLAEFIQTGRREWISVHSSGTFVGSREVVRALHVRTKDGTIPLNAVLREALERPDGLELPRMSERGQP